MGPMKHPLLWALGAGLAVLLLALALPLLHLLDGSGRSPAAKANADTDAVLPWQVQPDGDGGSRVMGLRPGHDTLGDVQARLGDALQVALVARLGEVGSLEALMEPYAAGFVTGRLVLAFDVPAEVLKTWRAAVGNSSPMADGVRRFALRADHLAEARGMRLAGLSLVPSLKLDEADVRQRFGPPASQQALGDGALALLYPAWGLVATVKPGSRAVLQYVAPRDFERRFLAPMAAAASATAADEAAASSPQATR